MSGKQYAVAAVILTWVSCGLASPPIAVQLVEVKKIWDQAPHNAFTDLVRWNDTFYCAFREGRGHVSTDGKIRILESKDADTWNSAALISLEGYDLRDAHLSVTPDGMIWAPRLMLVGGAALRKQDNQGTPTGTFVSFGTFWKGGIHWSKPQIVVEPGRWLWCVTWHKGKAYGVSYTAGSGGRYLDLLVSTDGISYEPHVARLFEQGRPTEVTLRFDADGTCYALVRRDRYETEPTSAFLGVSRPDYKQWQWKDLGADFNSYGGPNFIQIPGGHWLAAGRMHDGGAHTALCYLDVQNGVMTRLLKLPSGGDTSYPGLVWQNDMLYMSYYSSHETKTSIYLAKLRIQPKPAVETAESASTDSFLTAEQILAAWESTYASIKTMRVSYSNVLVDYRPPASNLQERPPVKYTHVKRVEDGRRYHIRFSTAETGFDDPESLTERAFDGTVTRDFLAAKKSGSIFLGLKGTSLETENFFKMYMLLETYPYLREKYPNGVPAFVLSLTRALAAGGVTVRPSLERVAGQLCHVVEVVFPGRDYKGVPRQGKKLFWVAHDRGMCLMKYQRYWDEELFDEMEVEQVAVAEMDGAPIWYPQRAHWILLREEGAMSKLELNVTEFVPNVEVDENTFRFDFPKGTHVFDEVRGISGVDLPGEPPSLVGKTLPAMKNLGLKLDDDQTKDRMIFICFFDMNQRPSRNCITQLAKQAEQLKEKGVFVVAVQASKVDQKALNEWVKKNDVLFPVGMVQGDEDKTRFAWGVKSLPWLILTNKEHIVTAEGFGLGELDEKLKQAGDGK